MTRLGRLVLATSLFTNRRGLYTGRRTAKLHVAVYRWSGGRLGGHIPGAPEARILLLDHVGAKSGLHRTSPLMYVDDGNGVAVVASKAGQPTHPAWFHNLTAHPDTRLQIGPAVRPVHARVASDAERERLWPKFVAFYPAYGEYQRWAAPRRLPVVILEPR
jgi:deazaflavin-dependent oxidoreductase (nitroreductase family)